MPTAPKPWLVDLLDPSGFIDPTQPLDPGFQQLVNDIVGNAGGPADGFDQIVQELAGFVDALGPALQATEDDLDVILGMLAAGDTSNLDNSFMDYAGAEPASTGFLDSFAALAPPALGLLPLNTTGYGNPNLTTGQQTHDFGTVKLGSAPQSFQIARFTVIQGEAGPFINLTNPTVNGAIFQSVVDEVDTASGNQRFTYSVQMTPVLVGQFSSQVTYYHQGSNQYTILTLTVNVIP